MYFNILFDFDVYKKYGEKVRIYDTDVYKKYEL